MLRYIILPVCFLLSITVFAQSSKRMGSIHTKQLELKLYDEGEEFWSERKQFEYDVHSTFAFNESMDTIKITINTQLNERFAIVKTSYNNENWGNSGANLRFELVEIENQQKWELIWYIKKWKFHLIPEGEGKRTGYTCFGD